MPDLQTAQPRKPLNHSEDLLADSCHQWRQHWAGQDISWSMGFLFTTLDHQTAESCDTSEIRGSHCPAAWTLCCWQGAPDSSRHLRTIILYHAACSAAMPVGGVPPGLGTGKMQAELTFHLDASAMVARGAPCGAPAPAAAEAAAATTTTPAILALAPAPALAATVVPLPSLAGGLLGLIHVVDYSPVVLLQRQRKVMEHDDTSGTVRLLESSTTPLQQPSRTV